MCWEDFEKRKVPLVVHVINRLALGGLENGLVNIINHMPPERYRHAIVCLRDFTDFRKRINRPDVPVMAMDKCDGQDFSLYKRLWRIFKDLQPAIVHTRNFGSLEYSVSALLAGVPRRVHGEHGRDMDDLMGMNWKYRFLRQLIHPFIDHYIAVSADLAQWLTQTIRVSPDHITSIYNGVDTDQFFPRQRGHPLVGPHGFATEKTILIGTVGRMEQVKGQMTLVRAFLDLICSVPEVKKRLRLALIGDGSMLKEIKWIIETEGISHLVWTPGESSNIPEIMRSFDIFVLPSVGEGISNTILEAMATGLPVVATRVGGNPELVDDGETGRLVSPGDFSAMAQAIQGYLDNPEKMKRHGLAGLNKVRTSFSLKKMVAAYMDVYDGVLSRP